MLLTFIFFHPISLRDSSTIQNVLWTRSAFNTALIVQFNVDTIIYQWNICLRIIFSINSLSLSLLPHTLSPHIARTHTYSAHLSSTRQPFNMHPDPPSTHHLTLSPSTLYLSPHSTKWMNFFFLKSPAKSPHKTQNKKTKQTINPSWYLSYIMVRSLGNVISILYIIKIIPTLPNQVQEWTSIPPPKPKNPTTPGNQSGFGPLGPPPSFFWPHLISQHQPPIQLSPLSLFWAASWDAPQ